MIDLTTLLSDHTYLIMVAVLAIYLAKLYLDLQADKAVLAAQKKREEEEPNTKQTNKQEGTQEMTLAQLGECDGSNGRNYLAVKDVIMDVSHSHFYAKDGPYGVFAGKDCSVALATMKIEESACNVYQEQKHRLTQEEKDTLDQWLDRLQNKYPVVGKVIY